MNNKCTASTVGYGDFSPKTDLGRALAIVFIPFAVSTMGIFLGTVANAIISHRQKTFTTYLQNKPLTMDDIRILDRDGDGNVTRAEFFQFMLVAMNQVDNSLFDGLNAHFDRLDADKSGTINKDDLATMAKHQIRSNHKDVLAGSFRLANYREYQQPSITSTSIAMEEIDHRRPPQIASNQSRTPTRQDTKRKKAGPPSYQSRPY